MRIKKTNQFYNASKEEWLSRKEEFRGKLSDILAGNNPGAEKYIEDYFTKGFKEDWLKEIWPKASNEEINKMKKREWRNYSLFQGYYKLSRMELKEANNVFYRKGMKEGWIDGLISKNNIKQVLDDMLTQYNQGGK